MDLKLNLPPIPKKPMRSLKGTGRLFIFIVVILILAAVGSRVFVIIPANSVGIRFAPFSGGVQDEILEEGLNIVMPWDKIYEISTEVQSKQIMNVYGQTMDAQFLTMTVDIKYKVDKTLAFEVFKNFKTLDNVDQNLIIPTTQRAIEATTTQYNIIEVLGSKRNEVYLTIEANLQTRFQENGISLHSVTFLDTDAGDDIEDAITREAVAKKAVETAEQQRLQAQIDAERRVIEAQAEADEKRIIAESLAESPAILELEWIKKWDGVLPEVMAGDTGGIILDLNKTP